MEFFWQRQAFALPRSLMTGRIVGQQVRKWVSLEIRNPPGAIAFAWEYKAILR